MRVGRVSLLALAALAAFLPFVLGQDCTTTVSTAADLDQALRGFTTDVVVCIQPGTYALNNPMIYVSRTVRGLGAGPGDVIITPYYAGNGNVLNVNSMQPVTLSNFRLSGGETGLVVTNAANVIISNLIVDSNTQTSSGQAAGIHLGSSVTISITDSIISSNAAYAYGGGMIVAGASNVQLTNVTFVGNSGDLSSSFSEGYGGAIAISGSDSTVTITGCTFINNTAENGGAIGITEHMTGVQVAISKSTFSGNIAEDSGHAFFSDSQTTTLVIYQSTFTGNVDTENVANTTSIWLSTTGFARVLIYNMISSGQNFTTPRNWDIDIESASGLALWTTSDAARLTTPSTFKSADSAPGIFCPYATAQGATTWMISVIDECTFASRLSVATISASRASASAMSKVSFTSAVSASSASARSAVSAASVQSSLSIVSAKSATSAATVSAKSALSAASMESSASRASVIAATSAASVSVQSAASVIEAAAASAASVTSAQSVTSVQSSASVASVALVSSASAASVASAASANSLISVDFVVSVDSVVSVASVRSIGGGSTTATPAPSAVQSSTHILSSARDGSSAASVASSSSASLALPPQSDQASSSSSAIVGAVVGIVLLVLIAVVAFVLYRRHKRRLQPFGSRVSLQKSDSTLVPMQAVGFSSSQSQSQSEVYASPNQVESAYATVGQRVYSNDPPKPSPEYAYATSPGRIYSDIVTETTSLRQGLVLGAKLGSGAFGVVLRGQLPSNLVPKDAKYLLADERQPHLDVAVKTIPSDADPKSRREFIEEARMMARFDNPNVVRAICSLLEAEPLLCVLELMPFGDLRGVLQKSIKVQVSWTRAESAHALAQVARGLDYLEQIRFVHRDIAARNCLVGANLAVKISDFGLSRAIAEESDYYRMETKGRLPVKWMAPECLLYRKFTHQSDVWAFGVLAWEVYSYGASPYGNQKGPEILAQVEGGFRLQKPSGCADVDFEQVFKCWNREPLSRPSFAALSAYFAQVALNTPVRDIGLLVSS